MSEVYYTNPQATPTRREGATEMLKSTTRYGSPAHCVEIGGADVSLVVYDDGNVQLNMRSGCASFTIYPCPDECRLLAKALTQAAKLKQGMDTFAEVAP